MKNTQRYLRSSPHIVCMLIVLGCVLGCSYVMAQKPKTLAEQLAEKSRKLKHVETSTKQPAVPAVKPAPSPAVPTKTPAASKPMLKPTTDSKAAEKARYQLLIDIIAYHNTKHTNKIADNELAAKINQYFVNHKGEITQGSLTTDLLRVFVKDLVLSISNQAYEIAKNITKLNSGDKASAEQQITKAREITQKNIAHLPNNEVLLALSKALPAENKDTAINLPKAVQKLLGESNTKIADEEFPELTAKLFTAATGKPFPAAPAKPTAQAPKKPATVQAPAAEPTTEESSVAGAPPPPPPMPQKKPTPATATPSTRGTSLLEQLKQGVQQLKKVEQSPSTTPPARVRPSVQDLQERKRSLTPPPSKPQEQTNLTKAEGAIAQAAQIGRMQNLMRQEQVGTISSEDKTLLESLKKLYAQQAADFSNKLAKSPAPQPLKPYQSETEQQILKKIAQRRTGTAGQETFDKEKLQKELNDLLTKQNRTTADNTRIQRLQDQIAQIEQQEQETSSEEFD